MLPQFKKWAAHGKNVEYSFYCKISACTPQSMPAILAPLSEDCPHGIRAGLGSVVQI